MMAGTAYITTVDMTAMFSTRRYIVMARNTFAGCKRSVIRNSQCGCPRICGMTNITLSGCHEMTWTFANGNHVVVAAGAKTVYFIVIHRDCWCPRCRALGMAGIADIGGINMGRMFAASSGSIVATDAIADYLRMVNCAGGNGCPGGRKFFMACITHIAAGNMGRAFTAGE